MRRQPGVFDVDDRLKKRLSDLGDQLLAFAGAEDFEAFRPGVEHGYRLFGRSPGRFSLLVVTQAELVDGFPVSQGFLRE